MVNTERATEATGAASRINAEAAVASRQDRMSRYATVAKMAAVIPAVALASAADGTTVYSRTGLNEVVRHSDTPGAYRQLDITGASGAVVAHLNFGLRSNGSPGRLARALVGVQQVGTTTAQAHFRNVAISDVNVPGYSLFLWYQGLPVSRGATWNNVGRTGGDFKGGNGVNAGGPALMGPSGNGYSSRPFGNIPFGRTDSTGLNDPLNVGNTGQEWFLLFKLTGGTLNNTYGWIAFTANVQDASDSYVTITGWGWDDSGATIGAGVTASAVPGGAGLAALAFGAAGLRGRRRSRN